MKLILLIALIFLAAACSGGKQSGKLTKEEALSKMEHYEDSVKMLSSKPEVASDYAEKCLAFYREFPNSAEAPKYLDRAHMILSSSGMNQRAMAYADTLIQRYPKYENRPMVLMSLATAYDMFIVPRNKEKAEKYYRMWLEENPKAPIDQREDVQFRLNHIDLTYDEMLNQQLAETSGK